MREFILGGSKITADGDYNHEIKRHLFLGRKLSAKELMLLNCGCLNNVLRLEMVQVWSVVKEK